MHSTHATTAQSTTDSLQTTTYSIGVSLERENKEVVEQNQSLGLHTRNGATRHIDASENGPSFAHNLGGLIVQFVGMRLPLVTKSEWVYVAIHSESANESSGDNAGSVVMLPSVAAFSDTAAWTDSAAVLTPCTTAPHSTQTIPATVGTVRVWMQN
jgi:hypothetical protein